MVYGKISLNRKKNISVSRYICIFAFPSVKKLKSDTGLNEARV